MTEISDFSPTGIQSGTTQGDLASSKVDKNQSNLDLKPSDPKTSEVSHKILTPEKELSTPKSLSAHHFELGKEISNENESASLEKADLVGSKTLPQSKEIADSNLDTLQQEEVHSRSKIENQLKNSEISISDQIQSMNEDELIEAMENPDFAEHMEEISTRLDELEQEIQELKTANKKTITEATEKRSESIELKKATDAEAASLSNQIQYETKNLYYTVGVRVLHASEVALADQKPENALYKESNLFISASKENTKLLKEGKLEFKNDNGVFERQRHDARDMTEQEKEALETFISSNFTTIPTNTKEETHADESKHASSQFKSSSKSEELPKDNKVDNRVETNHEKQTISKTNVEGATLTPILRNYQKTMKELRHKEEKIKKEVHNHEILVNNIKQNNLKIEVNNSDAKVKEIKIENEKLNQQYADLYKEFLEVSTHIEVPEPLREKFQEEIRFPEPKQFKQFDDVINHSNGHLPVLKAEIMTYKKEVMKTIQSILKDTGSLTNVRVGKQ